jgi:1-acyl-sn-glycerol-3-phosphate acyltransferase
MSGVCGGGPKGGVIVITEPRPTLRKENQFTENRAIAIRDDPPMPFSLKRSLRDLLYSIYGVYTVIAFLVLGSLAFLLVLLPLGIRARRQVAHATARLFFMAAAIRVRLIDEHLLPAGPCVVVANHASYLDGVVLKAMLPARFCFVIKKEVSRVPLAGLLLRRIGSEFVDRVNRHAGAMDARRLLKAADSGQALAFFPEGTFIARPGVGKFHTGAFVIAARTKLPVVPIAIRGTRDILPSERFLPKPGRIEIQVLPAIFWQATDGTEAVAATRDLARARIVAELGEPDLCVAQAEALEAGNV